MKQSHHSPTLIDLSQWYGLIKVSGPDSLRFLNGQVTIDVAESKTDILKLGAYCTPKGRIRTLFRIFKQEDIFFLQCPKVLLNKTLQTLKNYARFSKVTIESDNNESTIYGLVLENEKDLLKITDTKPDSISILVHSQPEIQALKRALMQSETNSLKQEAYPTHYPSLFELIGHREKMEPFIQWLSHEFEVNHGDLEQWQLLELRLGYPEILPETEELFLPHHLNLPALGAVDFTKGCYSGQEIIARMHYRGKIKRGLALAELQTKQEVLPILGSEIELSKLILKNDFTKNLNQHYSNDANAIIVNASFNESKKVEVLVEIPIS